MRKGKLIRLGTVVVLLLGGPPLATWVLRSGDRAGPCVMATGPAALPELPEASGLAVSRRTPGVLWSHNDSGNAAVLFALEPAGAVRGRVRVPVPTRDWEDVSAAGCASGPCLYIADIGDNRRERLRVFIHRVAEPAPGDPETAAPETFVATYEDGPHNAEALFVVESDLFIVTRDRVGAVYRATAPASGGGALTFRRVGQLGLEAVTDAETSRDGTTVVVRTSHEAILYRTADLLGGTMTPYLRIAINRFWESQGEGVALDGDMLYLSSEGAVWDDAGSLRGLRCRLTP